MIKVLDFDPRLASALPDTYTLLQSSNLTVHARVSRIILHGSRGLAGRYRADSDIDLSLLTDYTCCAANLELLRDIYETTCYHWKSSIELDLAVVFETNRCQLKCFDQNTWNAQLCATGGVDCFGLYKIGKGFDGLVTNAGIQVERMYPCLTLWARG